MEADRLYERQRFPNASSVPVILLLGDEPRTRDFQIIDFATQCSHRVEDDLLLANIFKITLEITTLRGSREVRGKT